MLNSLVDGLFAAAITCNQMFQFSIGFLNKREQAYERLKGQQAKQFIHTKVSTSSCSTLVIAAFVPIIITPGQFYSVISTHANHALSVLFSCQYNCKSRLVSFIQLSVQLQITTVLVNLRIVPVFHKFYFLLYTSDLCLHS